MRILLSLLCVGAFLNAQCQNDTIKWQNRTPLPSIPRIDYASWVIDSDYYIIGGLDAGFNTYGEVWKYNIPGDSWQRMRNFPGGPVSEPAGFALNGNGYICCGIDSVTNYNKDNEFWEYYPAVDSWQHKANYPGTGREIPMSFVYENYAFIGMGWGVGANDIWRYNNITDSWNSVSNMPTGSRGECGVVVIDSFTYILGGFNEYEYNDVWRYNINHDHWDSIGIMPGGLRANSLFWKVGNFIITGYGILEDTTGESVTGIPSFSLGTDFYRYNIDSNTWDTLTCMNFPDSIADGGGAGCFVLDKTVYFFGGYESDIPSSTYYNNLWSFDASKFFSPDTPNGIAEIKNQVVFIVYPNPIKSDQRLSIFTSESGEIFFYDEIGRLLDDRKINQGLNQIKLITNNEVVFYRATLQCGETENGKIVILK